MIVRNLPAQQPFPAESLRLAPQGTPPPKRISPERFSLNPYQFSFASLASLRRAFILTAYTGHCFWKAHLFRANMFPGFAGWGKTLEAIAGPIEPHCQAKGSLRNSLVA